MRRFLDILQRDGVIGFAVLLVAFLVGAVKGGWFWLPFIGCCAFVIAGGIRAIGRAAIEAKREIARDDHEARMERLRTQFLLSMLSRHHQSCAPEARGKLCPLCVAFAEEHGMEVFALQALLEGKAKLETSIEWRTLECDRCGMTVGAPVKFLHPGRACLNPVCLGTLQRMDDE